MAQLFGNTTVSSNYHLWHCRFWIWQQRSKRWGESLGTFHMHKSNHTH